MKLYCPRCWHELSSKATACPACGGHCAQLSDEQSYVEKLIAALNHPEPRTPVRAAWILGQLRATVAVPALIEVVRESDDFYLIEAAVEALEHIGDPASRPVLTWAAAHGALRVRRAAERALKQLDGDGSGASRSENSRVEHR